MINWIGRLTGETQSRLLNLLRRSHQTITSLAQALSLTDNAVRMHIAALRHDGIVEDVGTQRDTGGKPARLYGLTREGEELFPKAYALVLGRLVEEIVRTEGRARAIDLLRAVGAQAGAGTQSKKSIPERVAAAAQVFRELGSEMELEETDGGWKLQGYGCPLSAVTSEHPEMCELGKAVVEEIVGAPVTECCQRSGGHPRCGFVIPQPA